MYKRFPESIVEFHVLLSRSGVGPVSVLSSYRTLRSPRVAPTSLGRTWQSSPGWMGGEGMGWLLWRMFWDRQMTDESIWDGHCLCDRLGELTNLAVHETCYTLCVFLFCPSPVDVPGLSNMRGFWGLQVWQLWRPYDPTTSLLKGQRVWWNCANWVPGEKGLEIAPECWNFSRKTHPFAWYRFFFLKFGMQTRLYNSGTMLSGQLQMSAEYRRIPIIWGAIWHSTTHCPASLSPPQRTFHWDCFLDPAASRWGRWKTTWIARESEVFRCLGEVLEQIGLLNADTGKLFVWGREDDRRHNFCLHHDFLSNDAVLINHENVLAVSNRW